MQSQPDLLSLLFRLVALTRRQMSTLMASEHWAPEANLRPGCGGVLRLVGGTGGISQREIADRMALAASDVVDLVDRLEAAGYVRRDRDPADRRRNVVALTKDGRQALRRFGAVTKRAEADVFAALSPDERAALHDLLARAVGADRAGS